jgi:sugar (pentulose or hexulose) kinase
MKYVIAYDLGTSSIKASVVDSNTNVIESAVKETHTFSDSNGIREQRPEEWKSALIEVTNKLLEKFPYPDKIECISISGHSLGVVAIDDRNNLLIDKTPIWSDERAKKEADSLGLYEYPPIEMYDQNPILSHTIKLPKNQDDALRFTNGFYGKKHQFRAFVLLFENKGVEQFRKPFTVA